jgi:demethylmenaquinone methyltransferase/2-methoxy-6-polyprenyl-1,4-benzoquinol methylase
MSTPLPHANIIPLKDSEKTKKEQVADMFDRIAGRFDFMNRFLSAGLTSAGGKKAIISSKGQSAAYTGCGNRYGRCGTDGLFLLKPQQITGIDISEDVGMLERKKKIEKRTWRKISYTPGMRKQ